MSDNLSDNNKTLTLYLRRPINNTSYRRPVKADRVSQKGAKIICDVPLETGAKLEVSSLQNLFLVNAVVQNIEHRADGKWSIDLRFTKKEKKRSPYW